MRTDGQTEIDRHVEGNRYNFNLLTRLKTIVSMQNEPGTNHVHYQLSTLEIFVFYSLMMEAESTSETSVNFY
jgi:hypothetical protein